MYSPPQKAIVSVKNVVGKKKRKEQNKNERIVKIG